MGRQSQMLLAALAVACAGAGAGAGAEESSDPHFAFEAGIGLVSHEGLLQTPAGGEPGTASAARPTLDELSVGNGHYRWLAGAVGLGRYVLTVRYSAIGDAGSATLTTPLVSQGNAFDAGSDVGTVLSLDGLSLKFTRSFEFGGNTLATLGPWIGWTAFDLDVDGGTAGVDRSYRVYALGASATLDATLGRRWRAGTEVIIAPAFDGSAARYAVEPSLTYYLRDHVQIRLAARLAAFRYDDAHKQVWPNRLRVDRRVMPAVSLRLGP